MLNAQETIDGLKEDIKTEEKSSEEIVEESTEKPTEEVVEEVAEEVAEEETEEITEETVEEPVEEVIEDEKLPKDNKAWAKMRHKIKERDGQIDDLHKTLDEVKIQLAEQRGFQDAQIKANEPQIDTDPEPDVLLDPEDHTSWSLRQIKKENEELRTTQGQHAALIQNQQDRQSIEMLESNFSQKNPDVDYHACEKFLKDRERKLLKLQYPQAIDSEINTYIEDYKVSLFKEMAVSGRDATSLIVELAKENGFETGKNIKKKPDFATLKKNQAKNASLIGGSDAVKEHNVTSEQIYKMSMDDLVKGGKNLFDKAHKNS